MKVDYHKAIISKDIHEILDESVNSGWLTTGPKVKKYEAELAQYFEVEHVVAVNSCTAALHLSLAALNFPRASKFIAPTYTFVASVEVGEYLGMIPVLVDCKADTFNMDLDEVERVLLSDVKKDIKVIIPVHFAGQTVDMERINAIAMKYDLFVLEDCAHATESVSNIGKTGSTNSAACFSFYANKNVTTGGEGGAVATNSKNLADKIRLLSLHGMSKDGWKRFEIGGAWAYNVSELGYKCNMTDISASFGLDQLPHIGEWQKRRINIAKAYEQGIGGVEGIKTPKHIDGIVHAWHLYVITIIPELWKIGRDKIIDLINQKEIGTSVHYIPIHMHSYYSIKYGYKPQDFPVAMHLSENVISLPIYPRMTDPQISYVITTLTNIWEQNKK